MKNVKDLTGQKIEMLTILKRKRENNRTYYLCKCDCGNEKWIRVDYITSNRVKSCGCIRYPDLLNKKIGRLTVIEKTDKRDKKGAVIWKCKCDCGNIVEKSSNVLKIAKSCGCIKSEMNQEKIKEMRKSNSEKNIIDGINVVSIKRKNLYKNNKSGVTGVFYDNTNKKWTAFIYLKNERHRLGNFENKEDAIKARTDFEEKLYKKILRKKE